MLIFLILFSVAAIVQLTYFISLLTVFKRKTDKPEPAGVPVSVIVCAHDEEENLRTLIPQLLRQEYPDFEVIVVNDRSNDDTYDFLREESLRDPRLKMVNVKATPDHVNSKKFALTLGIRAAAHEWILHTDADCRPVNSHWISSMTQSMNADSQFVLGFSPYREMKGFLNLFIRYDTIVTALQYLSFAAWKVPYMGVGRNLAYRKSLFLEKKGFNHFLHITGGDDDLFVNQHATGKNTKIEYSPASLVYSVPKTTWSSFFYQKVRHLSVGKLYRSKHKFLLGLLAVSWVLTLFAGLPLLAVFPYYYIIPSVILLRWVFMILSFRKFIQISGLSFQLWALPVLDFLYPIYYISTGLVTLFTRKVRWKK